MRRSRNAATARSLAAFIAAGAMPPVFNADRARARAGNRSVSGASKVNEPIAPRSSPGAGHGSRSGQAKAQAIGVRMSGGPNWASVEPSWYSTMLWITDCG